MPQEPENVLTLNKILTVLPLIGIIIAGSSGFYVMQDRQEHLMGTVKEIQSELKEMNQKTNSLTNKILIEQLQKDIANLEESKKTLWKRYSDLSDRINKLEK